MKDLTIHSEFITLGQFLKMVNVISSGGMAKWYLDENTVYVNNEPEQRRGKKLRHNDIVEIPDLGKFKINEETDGSPDVY
ncbi:S4 domain-containing protein YaaA [Sporosarcina ureilytica]|uniref:RNA-binding protein n=1 Tax=Sporosarcina ureilytica TaxID=298596 RepID=A0A1D8JCC6_9BACL|nr:S4 domain-containing protein YaaA [Sporosarcina ureilytica]AOV06352.1 RNA-binding protein [Sporosarcina ureilytica]